MINSIEAEDYKDASDIFNTMLGDKIQSALDDKKVELAASIFNNAGESPELEPELEIDQVEDPDVEEEQEDENV